MARVVLVALVAGEKEAREWVAEKAKEEEEGRVVLPTEVVVETENSFFSVLPLKTCNKKQESGDSE